MAELKWNDIVWTLPDAMVRMRELEEQLATAERERDEARRMAQWTLITPENLPKKGQFVLNLYRGEWSVYEVSSDWTVDDISANDSPWWFFNPPPAPPKEG